MYQSVHTTVRDSYFYGTQDAASESYGTDTFTGGDHLIENNIFDHIASVDRITEDSYERSGALRSETIRASR